MSSDGVIRALSSTGPCLLLSCQPLQPADSWMFEASQRPIEELLFGFLRLGDRRKPASPRQAASVGSVLVLCGAALACGGHVFGPGKTLAACPPRRSS